jgi:hypothetical protein
MSADDTERRDRPEPSISNGPNARPRNESIGQTAGGLPNDSSDPVEISPEEEQAIARKILERK